MPASRVAWCFRGYTSGFCSTRLGLGAGGGKRVSLNAVACGCWWHSPAAAAGSSLCNTSGVVQNERWCSEAMAKLVCSVGHTVGWSQRRGSLVEGGVGVAGVGDFTCTRMPSGSPPRTNVRGWVAYAWKCQPVVREHSSALGP